MLRTGLLVICLMFALTACGQKGDLYLPDKVQSLDQPVSAEFYG
jgi:predicted small lipoprotein YifL